MIHSTRNIQCAYDAYSDMIGWTQNILGGNKLDYLKWGYNDLYRFIQQRCKDMDSVEFQVPTEHSHPYFVELEFSLPARNWAHGLQGAERTLTHSTRFPFYSAVHAPVDPSRRVARSVYEVSDGYTDFLDKSTWLSVSQFKESSRDTRPLGTVLIRDNLMYHLALLAQGKSSVDRVADTVCESIGFMKPIHNNNMHFMWSGYIDAQTPISAINTTLDMLTCPDQSGENLCIQYQGQQRMLNISRSAGIKVVKNKLSLI